MNTTEVLQLLRAHEVRNVTCIAPDGSWPVVWTRARGVHVWDAEGRRYVDLTAAFGVAATGHATRRVVRAAQRQLTRLLHAMGDVHPHPLKAQLARELSRITFERWTVRPRESASGENQPLLTGKTLFCNSGFEAVEAALKTAVLATGKPGVIAFEGAYHGLGYGALSVTHREFFRRPFRAQLGRFAHFLPFPEAAPDRDHDGWLERLADAARRILRRAKIGAVLVEPIQGRGGIRMPPPEFLPWLRRFCDEHGALLIVDEIYTGFGRTGRWFACEHTGVVPDVICLGKALAGGFPISACVGRADVMDAAWPESRGEALHTSTFAGHPVGCAMAMAQLSEIERLKLPERAALVGTWLLERLGALRAPRTGLRLSARGMGLMVGLEVRRRDGAPAGEEAFRIVKAMLRRGY
ncbi:MAG: aspartate aminotransferase family protein, partial [Verrucomicrobiales bacterium]|nr:aspartate aminotransferase family protein [Verrucomicrobiales bacterium]